MGRYSSISNPYEDLKTLIHSGDILLVGYGREKDGIWGLRRLGCLCGEARRAASISPFLSKITTIYIETHLVWKIMSTSNLTTRLSESSFVFMRL